MVQVLPPEAVVSRLKSGRFEVFITTIGDDPQTGYLVGKGVCRRVYRGVLTDGQSVATKLLNISPKEKLELLSEVEIIISSQHKNIIVLIGYCIYGKGCLLLYNFVSRGNLEENLHVEKGKPN